MSTALMPMTWEQLVISEVWWRTRLHIDQKTADYLLWEYTGFPAFFKGDPVEGVRSQIADYLNGVRWCMACGERIYIKELCATCAVALWRGE